MNLEEKIKKVEKILENKKIAIAFSGGADSSLITYLASKVSDNPLAITIDNNILPTGFVENTENFCKKYNVEQITVFEDFFNHEDIIQNSSNRCFLCRKEMYNHITSIAKENGYDIIVDGTNISDLVEDRPGILVNYENNIKNPFIEAKLTSKEIHEYLDKYDIPYFHSSTCLATRLPFNDKLTKDKYKQILESEDFIYRVTNCKIVKVRQKDDCAIVECENISELLKDDNLNLINNQLKSNGYKEVHLKLCEIDENKEININYKNNKFSYQLPYEIDIEKTKVKNKNIKISKKGLIEGNGFNSYEESLNEFMNILPHIIRKS